MKHVFKLLPVILLVLTLGCLSSSCNDSNETELEFKEEKVPADNAPVKGTLSGAINHEKMTPGDVGFCTVNRIPWTVSKFKELREQVATEPQGAVMMFVVAMEIYRQYPVIGEKCLALSVTPSLRNRENPIRINKHDLHLFKDKFHGKDSYAAPWLSMAYFEGATAANGYKPSKPYKIKVSVNEGLSYMPISSLKSKVLYLNAHTYGEGNRKRAVEVCKPSGEKFFLVNSYSDLISTAGFAQP